LGFVQKRFHVYLPDQIRNLFPNKENRQRFYNNYDNRILQANSIIRYVLNTLQDKGYLKNSMVIITSDHGQSLGEEGRNGHIAYLQREAIRIPLIIMDDSLSLYKNTQLGRQVDIAPTILKRLQLPVPAAWEGHSLLDNLKPGISFHENATWRPDRLYGFIQNDSTGIYRYMFNRNFSKESLYKVQGNTELDIFSSDPKRLSAVRNYALTVFDSVFTK
jgi:arylsulfatase A-like enzyme